MLLGTVGWFGAVSLWPAQANLLTKLIVFGLDIAALIAIWNQRIASRMTFWLSGPPPPLLNRPRLFRGPLSYDIQDAKTFYGRMADGDACWERLRSKPFFILEGESGCGKSSLLNAYVLPRARQVFHVIGPCRCGEDPFGKLRSALLQQSYSGGHKYGKRDLDAALDQIPNAPANGPARPVLLCIDQFEELFVTVKPQVTLQFVEALKQFVEDGNLRLVLAIRRGFSDLLLETCREVDPELASLAFTRDSYYPLRSFTAEQAEGVINSMLDREDVHGNDTLRRRDVREFAHALVLDLLRPPVDTRMCRDDEQRVLPVELQVVGWTYESLLQVGRFSAEELRQRGGKLGLYRDYVEDVKDYVHRRTRVPGATAILVLSRLMSPAGTRWPQSVQQISDSGLGLSIRQVDSVLQALAERFLVHQLPDDSLDTAPVGVISRRYELLHEHLVQLVAEAPEPALQRARDAEESLRFWLGRTQEAFTPTTKVTQTHKSRYRGIVFSISKLLRMPIPLGETLRLWRYASRRQDTRQMLHRNVRGFLCRFSIFLMVILAFAGSLWFGWRKYEQSLPVQLEYTIAHAPFEAVKSVWHDVDGAIGMDLDIALTTRDWFGALADAGEVDAALKAAAKVKDLQARSIAIAALAIGAARAGQFDLALRTAAEVEDPKCRSEAHAMVALKMAQAGRIDLAVQAATQIKESLTWYRESELQAQGDQLDAAFAAASHGTFDFPEIYAFLSTSSIGRLTQLSIPDPAHFPELTSITEFPPIDPSTPIGGLLIADHSSRSLYIADIVMTGGANLFEKLAAEAQFLNGGWKDSDYEMCVYVAARRGELIMALRAAERVVDPRARCDAYVDVLAAAEKVGDVEVARKAAAAALESAAKVEVPTSQAEAYAKAILAAAQAGHLDAARKAVAEGLKAAAKVEFPVFQAMAYSKVIRAAAQVGQLDAASAAFDTAMSVLTRDEGARLFDSEVFSELAVAAAHADRLDAAFGAVSKLQSALYRSPAYSALAAAAVQVGNRTFAQTAIDAALKESAEVEEFERDMLDDGRVFYSDNLNARLAAVTAQADQFDVARQLATKIKSAGLRFPTYVVLASAAARAGNLEFARDSLKAASKAMPGVGEGRTPASNTRPEYPVLFAAAVQAHHLDVVLAALRDAPGESYAKDELVALAALVAACEGEFVLSVQTADRIVDSNTRSKAYARVAVIAARDKKVDLALNVAGAAIPSESRCRVHAALSGMVARAGEFVPALRAAAQVTDPFWQTQAFAAVVTAAQAGQMDLARAAIDVMMSEAASGAEPGAQSTIYCVLASVAAGMGHIEQALEADARIQSYWVIPKSIARRSISQALARDGRFFEARVLCESCEPLDKLKAYTVIVHEIARQHPTIGRQGARWR
jgi:hypothetical protein